MSSDPTQLLKINGDKNYRMSMQEVRRGDFIKGFMTATFILGPIVIGLLITTAMLIKAI